MEDIKEILDVIETARALRRQKSGMLAYWLKIDNRFIINNANISFLKKDRKQTIGLLREIQQTEGFLFWVNSPEGERFTAENYNKIVECLKGQQKQPWLNHEYGVKRPEVTEGSV